MELDLKETKSIETTDLRQHWVDDPNVSNYIYFEQGQAPEETDNHLTSFTRYYEIFESGRHVGDIKVFYETEQDIMEKRAQILMIVGERGRGIGTRAIRELIENMRKSYRSVYCTILRSNIASLKILKRNDFQVEEISGDELRLAYYF
jgi:RimJ/RimL family protein N-acetyltransferase